jgi:hypothetical protein
MFAKTCMDMHSRYGVFTLVQIWVCTLDMGVLIMEDTWYTP